MGDRTRDDGAIVKAPHLAHQRERRQHARVADRWRPRTRESAVNARLQRLFAWRIGDRRGTPAAPSVRLFHHIAGAQ